MASEKDDRLFAMFAIEMDEHPKIIGLSSDAFRALFEATFYARRLLTDGFLDERVVLKRWGQSVADELSSNDAEKPSWIRVERGWLIHDWEKHHPMRADIEARKASTSEKRRQAGRKGAANRWQADGKAMANDSPESDTETDTSKAPKGAFSSDADAIRPDVSQLLDLLDSELRSNGVKKIPKRTKTNIDSMRRLIDVDGYTAEQIARIIRWCQQDAFWKANILSASKLREKYEQLRLRANEEREKRLSESALSKSDEAHDFITRLEAIDAVSGGGEAARDYPQLRQ